MVTTEPRPIKIDGRNFVQGVFPCINCGREFQVLIPEAALYWWSRLCSQCDPTLEDLKPGPQPGEVIISIEEMPQWGS